VTRRGWVALLAGALLVLAVFFGARAYRSWQALHRPATAAITDTTQIQPWMTVRYVARVYRVPRAELAAQLGVAPDGGATLLALAHERSVPVGQLVAEVRQDVRDLQARQPPADTGPPTQ